MDWCQITAIVSDIALPLFTGGLVFATILLWRSTKRYAKATDKLVGVTESYTEATNMVARSTGQHVDVSEKLLGTQRLDLAERIYDTYVKESGHARTDRDRKYFLAVLAGVGPEDSDNDKVQKLNKFNSRLREVCGTLTMKMLEDVLRNFTRGDKE